MARLDVEGEHIVLRLSALEKLGAMHRNVTVPLTAVRDVRATDTPWSELRGLRAPGTGIPGVIALCTLRGRGFRDFAAIYRRGPAVVIDAEGAKFDRLIVSCVDAASEVARLRAELTAPDPPAPAA